MQCNDSVKSSAATNFTILLWKSFYKMFFNSISRNVNNTLLCITNTRTMLYAASPENTTRPDLFEFFGFAPAVPLLR